LDLLDRLPSPNWRRWWSWTRGRSPVLWLAILMRHWTWDTMRIGTVVVGCRRVEHRHIVTIVLPVMWPLFVGRVVGLVVVAIVMGLRVHAVFTMVAIVVFVVVVVAVGIANALNRVLPPVSMPTSLQIQPISSTHRWLRLHAIARRAWSHWHIQRTWLRQICSVGQRYGRRCWRAYRSASASASSWRGHSVFVAIVRGKVVFVLVRATMGRSCSSD
jgi:hypothetical protein